MVNSAKILCGPLLACAMLFGGMLRAASKEDEALLDIVSQRYENVSNRCCFAADEAKRLIDEVFAKTPVFQLPGRAAATKRLIDDGMATLVSFEADVWNSHNGNDAEDQDAPSLRHKLYELALKWMESGYTEEHDGRGRIWHRNGAHCDGTSIAIDRKGNVKQSHCAGICDFQFDNLLGKTASLELVRGKPKNAEEAVVVADVEIVDLASLGNLDHVTPAQPLEGERGLCGEHSARATYVVEMRVRAVKCGECKFRRFSFRAVLDEWNASVTGDWLFYRGMTLEVGLSHDDGKLKICRLEPVSPYPPYSKDGICIFNDEVNIASKEKGPDDVLPADVRQAHFRSKSASRIAVLYGGGELAVFESTTNLVEGVYGVFPDYGPHVKITVYGHDKTNLDYWRYAWFAYGSNGARSFGACGDLSPEGDGKNADPSWRSAVSIRTLSEQEWIVEATPKSADAPAEAPDLDVLTKELEAEGFASVAGAMYANVDASPASAGLYWVPEQDQIKGKMLDQRQGGNGWIVPPKEGEGIAKFLAYGCVWWEASVENPGTNKVRYVRYEKARLARDLVLVREYVDEVAELDVGLREDVAADILAFALHTRQAGFVKESERIVASLFARKRNGDTALKALKNRLAEVVRDYPDFATWEKKMLEKKVKEKSNGDESDE